MSQAPKLKPSIIIIFGITGDLAKRKILPALYNLCKNNMLSDQTKIIGISRRQVSIDEIIDTVSLCASEENNTCNPEVLAKLRTIINMFKLDPLSDSDYIALYNYLEQIEHETKLNYDKLIYLSIPPQVYSPIIKKLGAHKLNQGLNNSQSVTRLLIEKPFGYDLKSAEQLIHDTEQVFSEQQIFRIDHYLAKETAQNILKFRKHNPLFAKQWNSEHISKIHVIAKEKIGIENRVNFYEQVGAMRDLVQSHLMQLLALTAMEIPTELTPDEVHAAKHAFLSSLVPPDPSHNIYHQVIRGQYDSYRQEVANDHSNTETFVSIALKSRQKQWQNTIFQLTTGKSLDEKVTQIKIYFGHEDPNVLTFRIQPDEGIDINILIEKPGFHHNLQDIKLNFSYSQEFDSNHEAYERVLVDAIRGDRLLFASKLEVIASWQILQPIFDAWQRDNQDLVLYKAGSVGPKLAIQEDSFSDKLN